MCFCAAAAVDEDEREPQRPITPINVSDIFIYCASFCICECVNRWERCTVYPNDAVE